MKEPPRIYDHRKERTTLPLCGTAASCCSLWSPQCWTGIRPDHPPTKAGTSPLSLTRAAPPHTPERDGGPLLGGVACEVPNDKDRGLSDHCTETTGMTAETQKQINEGEGGGSQTPQHHHRGSDHG